jgi:polar amino acid transport system substrate-binding protein
VPIRSLVPLAVALAVAAAPHPAASRSFASIKESGTIALCANPNALPFAAREGKRRGFQIELAEALARKLGVALEQDWVISTFDIARTDCDMVLDAIVDQEAQQETHLRLSKPYRRTGVVLAVRGDEKRIRSLDTLGAKAKIGVLVSSMAAMTLDQRGVETVPDVFEDELLTMLAKGEIDAAAVTPTAIGYYNLTHSGNKLRFVAAFDGLPNFQWNVAVGLRRPDPALQQAVDDAIGRLLADGTIRRIYARYGVELQPPK